MKEAQSHLADNGNNVELWRIGGYEPVFGYVGSLDSYNVGLNILGSLANSRIL